MICRVNLVMMGGLVLLSAQRLDNVKNVLILEKFREAQNFHLLKFLENKKKYLTIYNDASIISVNKMKLLYLIYLFYSGSSQF